MSDIQNLVDEIKKSTDFQINKKNLKEKILADLHITYRNGLFLITRELLAFLYCWEENELFLEDIYQNPVQINKDEFLTLCKQHYFKVMNEWYIQFNELKLQRSI